MGLFSNKQKPERADRNGYTRRGQRLARGQRVPADSNFGTCPEGTTFAFPRGTQGYCPCCGWSI